MDPKAPISAVLIAKNEAHQIAATLEALQFCSEIIVVDSFSTDQTASIAKSLGAKVIQQEFLGYGPQKDFGFSQATQAWVLSIDADEVVSSELQEEIIGTLNSSNTNSAYSIPRLNYFLNQPLRYGRESKDRVTRLFKKGKAKYGEQQVHEKLIVNGTTGALHSSLFHYTYRTLEHAESKLDKYAQLRAQQMHLKGKQRSTLLTQLLKPVYFIKHYILYGNILNGKPGLIWSKLMANYHFKKYIYLNQLNKNA